MKSIFRCRSLSSTSFQFVSGNTSVLFDSFDSCHLPFHLLLLFMVCMPLKIFFSLQLITFLLHFLPFFISSLDNLPLYYIAPKVVYRLYNRMGVSGIAYDDAYLASDRISLEAMPLAASSFGAGGRGSSMTTAYSASGVPGPPRGAPAPPKAKPSQPIKLRQKFPETWIWSNISAGYRRQTCIFYFFLFFSSFFFPFFICAISSSKSRQKF